MNNSTIEDVDVENAARKQLKGNIYLAQVTRVEPSLQAAFVEYGGNRQGFLAFSEIHPDYYRIPIEDRQKLLAEDSALAAEDDDASENDGAENNGAENDSGESDNSEDSPADANAAAASTATAEETETAETTSDTGNDDSDDDREARRRHARIARHYKIQEVISRRQIMLIQVVKEERGNKGAALTTYLSLAGRYCVLMPNTWHGGGVSRKISNAADRKRLKSIVDSLGVPDGMAVIVRTAGSKRTKAEISRDYGWLSRQWDDIRNLTMESKAPSLIHEEGNLVKKAIRDYYTNEVEEVLVEGAEAYKAARGHMKNLIPSHVKKVKLYDNEGTPLFQKFHIEQGLDAMHEPIVKLRSGGYLVINQTEALVAVDVNSGRATRERNIEETALKTNLEAAEAIALQLRQRDLSGLIVIDFIDMEVNRNQTQVERRLKDALRSDRARIQVGGISQFGLLEMSRQRLRPSLAETVTDICPHCNGSGRIRSIESAALAVLRRIEEEAPRAKATQLRVMMNAEIALYILNNKRGLVQQLEQQFNITIILDRDDSLIAPEIRIDNAADQNDGKENKNRERNRRRGDKSRNTRNNEDEKAPASTATDDADTDAETGQGGDIQADQQDADQDRPRRRRRRGKRGGRRRNRNEAGSPAETTDQQDAAATPETAESGNPALSEDAITETEASADDATDSPAKPRSRGRKPVGRRRKTADNNTTADDNTASAKTDENSEATAGSETEKTTTKPKSPRKKASKTVVSDAEENSAKAVKVKKKTTTAKKAPAKTKTAKKKTPAKKAAASRKTAAAKTSTADSDSTTKAATTDASKPDDSNVGASGVAVIDLAENKPAQKKRGWWSS